MAARPHKVLIIRLSSIGDIVLTSPIVRSLRRCLPEAELHYLTKQAFVPLVAHDPRIARVHAFAGDLGATVEALRAEGFDWILDLHRSIRSRIVRLRLGLPGSTYSKDRWPVLLHTKLGLGSLPQVHTVERYARALEPLGCGLDDGGLEFFIPDDMRRLGAERMRDAFPAPPVAVVLGGNYATKRWPREYFVELLNGLRAPVLLVGGKAEAEDAAWIKARLEVPCMDAVARYGLLETAALLPHARLVLTHDTGYMHIATALGCKVFSLWGNTVPELGFAPYKALHSVIIERKDVSCRPCTKLGYDSCPKGHFRCMRDLSPSEVLQAVLAGGG